MIKRVSTDANATNFRNHIQRQEVGLSCLQDNLATQTKFQKLRQDPLGVASAIRYDSYLTRLNKFVNNVSLAQSNLRMKETYISQALDIFNRLKELAIQGANSTYSQSDMRAMGIEANELLEELVSLANAKGIDGLSLFSGTRLETPSFSCSRCKVIDGYKDMISSVEYQGDIFERDLEVYDGQYISDDLVGNKVFWAQNQRIETPHSVEDYVATQGGEFSLDGTKIKIEAGEGIYDIIDKINIANVATRASLDPISKTLVFETTIPHQIWFDENTQHSRILQDLGILNDLEASTPFNYHQDLKIQGGSSFDTVIALRDSLLSCEYETIGSSVLEGLSSSLQNLLYNITDLGARDCHLSQTANRLGSQIPVTTQQYTCAIGLNISEAIVDFNTLNMVRETTLGAQAKVYQSSLLNFLK